MDSAKILLIDGNKEDRDSFSALLSEKGYNVYCADNGYEGLKKAKDEKFDLIILDLILPDINGEEICSRLKSSRRYSRAPILVLSAKDEIEDIEELFLRGVDDYIVKPPRLSYLISRIEFNITNKRVKK
jgi:DNA-binding response OmpR family regulator